MGGHSGKFYTGAAGAGEVGGSIFALELLHFAGLTGGDAGIEFGDLFRGAELIAKLFEFRPFFLEFE